MHCLAGSERTKVAPAVLQHVAHDLNTWKVLVPGDFDVRVPLIVFEADVEARPVFLDQFALEDQRLQFGLRHDPVQIGDLEHELFCLACVGGSVLKIGAHAVAQADGFADIDDAIPGVAHDVDTRLRRQPGQAGLYRLRGHDI